jgi:hypothetical protein
VSRWRSLIPLTALVVCAQMLLPGQSTARPIEKGHFVEDFHNVHHNFCGVPGLSVSDIGTTKGSFLLNSRGRDELPYGMARVRETTVVTNLGNQQYVVFWIVVLDKDLKIVDNRDGTSTATWLGTGNVRVVDSDGKLLAMNPGQSRGKLLIDNGGTPKNPYDDEVIVDLGIIKGSTGRSDDLCAAMVPALV